MLKKSFKVESSIYATLAIEKAIADFKDITTVTYHEWVLIVKGTDEQEIQEIFDEFMNYVIGVQNQ